MPVPAYTAPLSRDGVVFTPVWYGTFIDMRQAVIAASSDYIALPPPSFPAFQQKRLIVPWFNAFFAMERTKTTRIPLPGAAVEAIDDSGLATPSWYQFWAGLG